MEVFTSLTEKIVRCYAIQKSNHSWDYMHNSDKQVHSPQYHHVMYTPKCKDFKQKKYYQEKIICASQQ